MVQTICTVSLQVYAMICIQISFDFEEIERSVCLNDNSAWSHVVAPMALVSVLLPQISAIWSHIWYDGHGDAGPDVATDALLTLILFLIYFQVWFASIHSWKKTVCNRDMVGVSLHNKLRPGPLESLPGGQSLPHFGSGLKASDSCIWSKHYVDSQKDSFHQVDFSPLRVFKCPQRVTLVWTLACTYQRRETDSWVLLPVTV